MTKATINTKFSKKCDSNKPILGYLFELMRKIQFNINIDLIKYLKVTDAVEINSYFFHQHNFS